MIEGYLTPIGECENTIVIQRSKFICVISSVQNEEDAKRVIENIRKKHSLANHNCYAYIADDKGLIQKFSDDGEPQGTAGLPMLEVLKNKKLFKTVAVVTRYFGGIKLGTGGLTRAYSGSVNDCISKAKIVNMLKSKIYATDIEYDGYSKLLKILTNQDTIILQTDFNNTVSLSFAVKENCADKLLENINNAFNGKLLIFEKESGYSAF